MVPLVTRPPERFSAANGTVGGNVGNNGAIGSPNGRPTIGKPNGVNSNIKINTCNLFLYSNFYVYISVFLFLAHLSRRLIGELIVYPWSGVRRPSVRRPAVVRPSSVVHNAQASSSLKPLGRSKPNFMWSLLG